MRDGKKLIQIPYHLPAPKRKGARNVYVTPENLTEVYVQMHKLEEMVQKQIPNMLMGIEDRDKEIIKLRLLNKLKDEELKKLRRR